MPSAATWILTFARERQGEIEHMSPRSAIAQRSFCFGSHRTRTFDIFHKAVELAFDVGPYEQPLLEDDEIQNQFVRRPTSVTQAICSSASASHTTAIGGLRKHVRVISK